MRDRPDPARGVFDTLLVRDGRPQALERHLERLGQSIAELYGERLPGDLGERVRAAAAELAGPHRLRTDAVPTTGGLRITIATEPVAPAAALRRQVFVAPVVIEGGIGPHKWRDRRLLDELSDAGRTPLILDVQEELLEAASANVWILEDDRVSTPPADGRLLPGVTRSLLLEHAREVGLTAGVEPLSLARARAADAVFLTSSIKLAVGAVLTSDGDCAAEHAVLTEIRRALGDISWS
jgi:para-aminobenzoate synthetase / 4-amino-4-deoxychorismate lyase